MERYESDYNIESQKSSSSDEWFDIGRRLETAQDVQMERSGVTNERSFGEIPVPVLKPEAPTEKDSPSHVTSIVDGNQIRGHDAHGDGYYGASRGSRSHAGVDLIAKPGADVYSPFNGTVVREAQAYSDTSEYKGVVVRGKDEWQGYEAKILYADPPNELRGKEVKAGDKIGTAQDIGQRYKGITPHVHFELRKDNKPIDPTPFLPRR